MTQKTYTLTVKKKVEECKDTCTLILTPRKEDADVFNYKPAQFLNFHLDINGQKLIRSYSLSSSPLLNEDLTTTVKKVDNGQGSAYLVDELKEGDVIQSTRPLGRFFRVSKTLHSTHYFMIGAGSGITPLFSIIKTVLLSDEKNKVTLVYCNRDESSIIYKEAIEQYLEKFKNQFQLIEVLSQPNESNYDYKGRLNANVLNEILKKQSFSNDQQIEFYLCGPVDLMKMAEGVFLDLKFDKKQIHKESFGSPTIASSVQVPQSAVVISTEKQSKPIPAEQIKARMEGEVVITEARSDLSILENLVEAGHCPPFSCMEGNCMTCLASLKKGSVYQDTPGILDEENLENKEILTCQAKPISPYVEVDYDS